MKSHYAQKRDANEPDIVAALFENGFEVYRLYQFPSDILVGRNHWIIIEIKSEGGTLTPSQKVFHGIKGGAPRFIVRTVAEALALAQRYC